MSVYGEFFTKFMEPLFEGFVSIFKGLGSGLFQMFNIVNYITVINDYKSDLTGIGLVIMIFSIIFLVAIFALIVFLIYKSIRVYVRYRRNVKKEDMLIEEIDSLNNEIFKLKRQNAKISELTNENGEIEIGIPDMIEYFSTIANMSGFDETTEKVLFIMEVLI